MSKTGGSNPYSFAMAGRSSKYRGMRPWARKTRKYFRGKSSRYLNLSKGVPNGVSPLAKIKFAQQYEGVLSGAVADGANVFNANSCYDFDAALGGDQPPFFDSVCNSAAYNTYRVLSLDAKVTFVNTAAVPVRVAMYLSDLNTDMSLISAYELQNSKLCASTVLGPAGSKDQATLRKRFNLTSLFGKKVLTEEKYSASYNANPSDLFYLFVIVQSLDATTNVNCVYSIDCTQHTILEDLAVSANHLSN